MDGRRANGGAEALHTGYAELFPAGFARGKTAGLGKEMSRSDHHYMMSESLLRRAHRNGKRAVSPLRTLLDSVSSDCLGPVAAFSHCVT